MYTSPLNSIKTGKAFANGAFKRLQNKNEADSSFLILEKNKGLELILLSTGWGTISHGDF